MRSNPLIAVCSLLSGLALIATSLNVATAATPNPTEQMLGRTISWQTQSRLGLTSSQNILNQLDTKGWTKVDNTLDPTSPYGVYLADGISRATSDGGVNAIRMKAQRYCLDNKTKFSFDALRQKNAGQSYCGENETSYYSSSKIISPEIPANTNFSVTVGFAIPPSKEGVTIKGLRQLIYLENDQPVCDGTNEDISSYARFAGLSLNAPRKDYVASSSIGCEGTDSFGQPAAATMYSYDPNQSIEAARHVLSIWVVDHTISYYLDDQLIASTIHTRDRLRSLYPDSNNWYDAAFSHPFRLNIESGITSDYGSYNAVADNATYLNNNWMDILFVRTQFEVNRPADYQERYNLLAYTRSSFPEIYGNVPDDEVNLLPGPLGTATIPARSTVTETTTVPVTTTETTQETTTAWYTTTNTHTTEQTSTNTVTTTQTRNHTTTTTVVAEAEPQSAISAEPTATTPTTAPPNRTTGLIAFILALLGSLGIALVLSR
ncbi:MAG: hypothetical protein Q3962_02540 [Corynebacterium sp.]|nr:hypothetical protein [Corynebacterium sp.]